MSFPREHWRRIRTNNPLERLNREVRRRTRVVGAFPDGQSAVMLVSARLRHLAGTKWGLRRYLDMNKLREMDLGEPELRDTVPFGAACARRAGHSWWRPPPIFWYPASPLERGHCKECPGEDGDDNHDVLEGG